MTPTAPLSDADRLELLAGAPAPEPFTEEEIEAMYLDWLAREEARYCDGHKDQHYWAA